jgi:hypothetical protein
MTSMAIVRQIAQYDVVELTEPVDAAPAGARGAVLELLNDGGVAEIEITEPTLDGLDRIVYAPVAKLRVVS